MDERCCETVYPRETSGPWHGYRCTKKAVVERNNKPYCKIHDPEYIAQKSKERMEKWEAKRQASLNAQLDRAKTLAQAYITELENALTDLLDGQSKWKEIQYQTGHSDKRCKEIEALYHKVTKKPEPF